MIKLDDEFLETVGLAEMPAGDRPAFLQMIYEELELRVGVTLSNGLSDAQLEEFEAIMDRVPDRVLDWIDTHAPDFESDPIYQRMQNLMADRETPSTILCEYAATKWLEINRPDYQRVVADELDTIADAIRGQATEILAGHPTAVTAS
ncbi:DUF5663 domain-containing protein [Mycolicibacterium llatzerense]|uniref:DUF5663 domain-containing protein n=1 Tax=Mycolicibacterium llatzerense TaxID=280871 RepID=UPI0008DE7BD5|nr:DUF5663 domain-containing protein [Mycolicibacterium llatzerense]